ncbi:hypothetical protein CGH75_21965, partial [Vibrio parahaemolyticus]
MGNAVITASYLNPGTSNAKVSNEVHVDDAAAWSTSTPAIASITSPGGVVTADDTAAGNSTTATVTYDGKSDSIGINVTDAIIKSIEVTPADLTLPIATTQAYAAEATYTNGDTENITTNPD